jgi:hypothetical protein
VCSNLRELHLRLMSTERSEENKIYQILGSFPRIEKLNITLYHPYPFSEEQQNALSMGVLRTDGPMSPQSLRAALKASAMDDRRAWSAF